MFSQEVADEICRRLSLGETLRQICKTEGMPSHTTVWRWTEGQLDAPPEFANQYTRARIEGYDAMAEQSVLIADGAEGSEDVNRDRLRVDTRKWLLSKMLPKKYGDMTRFQHTGADGKPIELSMPLETARALLHADE